jgi:hypothetical protein
MDTSTRIILVFGGAIILVLIIAFWLNYRKNSALKTLWTDYQNALSGSDRRIALNAGRSYYSRLRGGGILTIYDEQAIANDLSTMK